MGSRVDGWACLRDSQAAVCITGLKLNRSGVQRAVRSAVLLLTLYLSVGYRELATATLGKQNLFQVCPLMLETSFLSLGTP